MTRWVSLVLVAACGGATDSARPSTLPVAHVEERRALTETPVPTGELEQAMALLDVLDGADLPGTDGVIMFWTENGPRWGLAASADAQECIVSIGYPGYLSPYQFPEEVELPEAVDRIRDYVQRVRNADPHVRASAIGLHSQGIASVMVLNLARKARNDGETRWIQPLLELALEMPHLSQPFDGERIMQLRGDVAFELLYFANHRFAANEEGATAAMRERLDHIIALEGTEAAAYAQEIRGDLWTPGDPNDGALLFMPQGGTARQQFESADFAGRVQMLLALLDDRRVIPSPWAQRVVNRVGKMALQRLTELAGIQFQGADDAREWWQSAQADSGYADARRRLTSPGRRFTPSDRLVTRMIEADRARAKREVPQIYSRLSQHERYGVAYAYVRMFEREAASFVRRLGTSRDPVDREIFLSVVASFDADDATVRLLRRQFETAVREGRLEEQANLSLISAMARRQQNDLLARHWDAVPTRVRMMLLDMAADNELGVAALDDTGLLFVGQCGVMGADYAAARIAQSLQREYDCTAALPERLQAIRDMSNALRARLSMNPNTDPLPTTDRFEGEGFKIDIDDPRTVLPASLREGVNLQTRQGIMRFLNRIVRSANGAPRLVSLMLRRTSSGLVGEIHARPRRTATDLRWDATVRGPNESHRVPALNMVNVESPLLHGGAVWQPLAEHMDQLLTEDGAIDTFTIELYF